MVKIGAPLSQGEMVIHLSMIVMEMNFYEKPPQCLQPERKGSFAENMMVACIEAEAKAGGTDLLQKSSQRIRRLLKNILPVPRGWTR